MTDFEEKMRQSFINGLAIAPDDYKDELTYNTIVQWDSFAHMRLIAELENTFDIMLDTDDVIDMSSVAKAKQIVKKYLNS